MKNILVPVDFTQGSRNAYTYALDLAHTLEGKVTLLYVYDKGEEEAQLPESLQKALALKDEVSALKALKQYGDLFQEDRAIQIPCFYALESGHPVQKIADYADRMNADLIIMSTWWAKGMDGMLATWMGNTGTKVMEQTKRPVLLIPENASFEGVKHIVYATNFKEKEQRIPVELVRLSESAKLDLSVVHVHRSGTFYGPIEFGFLNNMYRLEKGNINIYFYTIHHEKVFEGLNDFIKKESGDILSMLVHDKLSVLDRLLGPDVPQQMAFHSKIPLLILHQDYEM